MNFNALLDGAFDSYLSQYLDRYLNQSLGKRTWRTPNNLEESIRYSLMSPGKRIRPRMLLHCAEMLELPADSVLPAAIALEMIHCFTLIHDDLPCMDDDDFRRGMPTNHKKFGESVALLAGDALIALAIDVFLDSPVQAPRLVAGLKRLTWAMGPRGVIGGQAAESLMNSQSQIDELQMMHSQKTGALFSAALLIPKDLAGISDETPQGQAITQFAHTLGLAFQAADDLEDRKEGIEPTSILYYLSVEEVRRLNLERLTSASDALAKHWGEKALGLRKIANEIIEKTNSVDH